MFDEKLPINNDACLNVKCLTREKERVKEPTNTQTHLTHRREPEKSRLKFVG